MSNFTSQDEPKPASIKPNYSDLNFTSAKPKPAQPVTVEPQYSELEYITANNKLLSHIEMHLKSIQGMLQFFVLLAVLAIILQGCSALFALGR